MRNVSHSGSPARGLWLSTAVTLVLVLALAAQVTAGRPGEVQTGAFATGDSPRMPGRAAACLTGRFDVARNVPITWWFEYGPTAAYGSRTAEREREAPVDDPLERSCGADADDVYADVDDLAYGATYHYRLVGRFRDGRIEAGEERTFAPAATALRPQQRVSFQHDEGAPARRSSRTSACTTRRVARSSRHTAATSSTSAPSSVARASAGETSSCCAGWRSGASAPSPAGRTLAWCPARPTSPSGSCRRPGGEWRPPPRSTRTAGAHRGSRRTACARSCASACRSARHRSARG